MIKAFSARPHLRIFNYSLKTGYAMGFSTTFEDQHDLIARLFPGPSLLRLACGLRIGVSKEQAIRDSRRWDYILIGLHWYSSNQTERNMRKLEEIKAGTLARGLTLHCLVVCCPCRHRCWQCLGGSGYCSFAGGSETKGKERKWVLWVSFVFFLSGIFLRSLI